MTIIRPSPPAPPAPELLPFNEAPPPPPTEPATPEPPAPGSTGNGGTATSRARAEHSGCGDNWSAAPGAVYRPSCGNGCGWSLTGS